MTNLAELIERAIDLKQGNKEFALFYFPPADDKCWRVEMGNTCPYVSLGEADAEVSADGATPEEAVLALIEILDG